MTIIAGSEIHNKILPVHLVREPTVLLSDAGVD